MKRIILGASALTLAVFGTLAGRSLLERRAFKVEIETLRADLWSVRSKADSCSQLLAWQEQEFLSFDAFVDSLHTHVRSFEDPGQGGVPGEVYPEYLAAFQRYNDSVAVWEDRADSLQTSEAFCRALAESHNALQDSIRRRSAEFGGRGQ